MAATYTTRKGERVCYEGLAADYVDAARRQSLGLSRSGIVNAMAALREGRTKDAMASLEWAEDEARKADLAEQALRAGRTA